MQAEDVPLSNSLSHHPGNPFMFSFFQADVPTSIPLGAPICPDVEATTEMQALVMAVQRLHQSLEGKTKQEATYECLVENLSRELQQYREEIYFKLLRPIFLDLIHMYHDLGRLIDDTVRRGTSDTMQLMVENIESFQETIEETLRTYGVEAFCVEGNSFLASKQHVVRVIKTTDPYLDKQIARRLHKGFKYEEMVLSPEVVTVYKAGSEA